ncbi:imidazole glycerol phosphate synthase subunit HisH [Desulfovibrio ferrophilus]|uniref:Imidazole glycerol phosphate synthase subunit HisH n=1 Tax=Desulfovibrio ferrophilus TaxID=241368 RepID=A0A2Z6B1H1_9BACT|nr:imidazole glycerol phosphate synthase subunit HisH [Desulfovibrio ferrophilus]BBD09315.1 imidazole glycerol phosphate synthase subunit HisH [Desulfovibrio ferrophilus]
MSAKRVSIIDYGMGNLYSVKCACDKVGLDSRITDSPQEVERSCAVILPGVGAYGQAMEALRQRGLITTLRKTVEQGKPFMGICLGMQLMMSVSHEFGTHEGLGIFAGSVNKLQTSAQGERTLKVPHIGWNQVSPPRGSSTDNPWKNTPLKQVPLGSKMYFVHSYYVAPEDQSIALTSTEYAGTTFCSGLGKDNIWGFQFHPERSGPEGMSVYRAFACRAIH